MFVMCYLLLKSLASGNVNKGDVQRSSDSQKCSFLSPSFGKRCPAEGRKWKKFCRFNIQRELVPFEEIKLFVSQMLN